jgi:glycerol uptake facilitator protein
MSIFLSECIGTFILLLLGNGVVANVVLNKTKGQNSGWIVITFGWAMAVYIAVIVAQPSGAHLNPAVSIALAYKGALAMHLLPQYILAQCIGAALGAFMVWVLHKPHYEQTADADLKMATFCTSPAINNLTANLLTEIAATFVLVYTILYLKPTTAPIGSLDSLPVALVVLGVGLCLGGTTGYALNPARDFMPRLIHALLPIKNKANNNWAYSWVPIVGPIVGALLAAVVHNFMVAPINN